MSKGDAFWTAWERKRNRQRLVEDAEGEGIVADSMEVRKDLLARMAAGEIPLKEAQRELSRIKAGAKKAGKVTRDQAGKGAQLSKDATTMAGSRAGKGALILFLILTPWQADAQVPDHALEGALVTYESLEACYRLVEACEDPGVPPPDPVPPVDPPPADGCLNKVRSFTVTADEEIHSEIVIFSGPVVFTGSFWYPEDTPLKNDAALRSIATLMSDVPWGHGGVLAFYNVKGRNTKLTAKRQHKDDVGADMLQAKPGKGLKIEPGELYAFDIYVDDKEFRATIGTKTQRGEVPDDGRSVDATATVEIIIGHSEPAPGKPGEEVPVHGALYTDLCLRRAI